MVNEVHLGISRNRFEYVQNGLEWMGMGRKGWEWVGMGRNALEWIQEWVEKAGNW